LLVGSGIGGTSPYNILITGPGGFSSSLTNLTGLAGGTYNISVTDSGLPTPQVATDTVVITPSTNTSLTLINEFFCWYYPNSSSQNITPSFTVAANGGFTIVATPLDSSDNPTTPVITTTFLAGTTTAHMVVGAGGIFTSARYNFELTDSDGCTAFSFGDFRPNEGHVPASRLQAGALQTISTLAGTQTGQIYANGSGGWGGYSYQWFLGSTPTLYVSQVLNLSYAQYGNIWTCKITDSKGCVKITNSVVIT